MYRAGIFQNHQKFLARNFFVLASPVCGGSRKHHPGTFLPSAYINIAAFCVVSVFPRYTIDMKKKTARERFSIVKRAKSFTYAGRGLYIFIKTTHNAWVHLVLLGVAVILGFYFQISYLDWMLLTFAGGLVLAAEAFNTAIEIDINLTSPSYHPYARDTKDVAAAAVLIAAITAAIIGVFIFGHYILESWAAFAAR